MTNSWRKKVNPIQAIADFAVAVNVIRSPGPNQRLDLVAVAECWKSNSGLSQPVLLAHEPVPISRPTSTRADFPDDHEMCRVAAFVRDTLPAETLAT